MHHNQIDDLLKRYAKGQCSEEEKALIESTYLSYLPDVDQLSEEDIEKDLAWIQAGLPKEPKRFKIWNFKFASAAAVLVVISATLLYFGIVHKAEPNKVTLAKTEQILPGTDKAILTLANGRKVVLDKNAATLISDSTSGIKIRKTAEGELIYELMEGKANDENATAFNTIETPRGSQYKIILPDGTRVWLNAASSLRYPLVFSGKTREVDLDGEGYFEVYKNKNMPFLVNSGNQIVEVLGTHFNISSYANDPAIATTLLEGKVVVKRGKDKQVLNPGEQVLNLPDRPLSVNVLPDAAEKIAWKNGSFVFNHENLQSIMNRISRWYDVEVDYKGNFDQKFYSGTISKYESVTDVLKIMELTRSVKFKIEGRRITVTK